MKSLLSCFLLAALALGLGACGEHGKKQTQYLGGYRPQSENGRANYDNVSYWDGDGVPGSPAIRISLGEQRAYFYKGGELVGVSLISTGREGFDTPTGTFKIIQKDLDHKSSLYGDYVTPEGDIIQKEVDTSKDKKPPGAVFDGAKMPYFMRVKGGVGMHEGFLPGYPASHGCIRMPPFMAHNFFHNVELGTPVTITN